MSRANEPVESPRERPSRRLAAGLMVGGVLLVAVALSQIAQRRNAGSG